MIFRREREHNPPETAPLCQSSSDPGTSAGTFENAGSFGQTSSSAAMTPLEQEEVTEHGAVDVLSTQLLNPAENQQSTSTDEQVQDPFEIHEKLTVVPLAAIIFYNVSGGAFGVEETVRSAGSFYTLLGFLVMPFVWSVQEALMTAELGSTFPEPSGCVAWVDKAFGHRMGFMSGYLSWVAGSVDNAIYPVLFCEYLLQGLRVEDSIGFPAKFGLFTIISCGLAYTNWLGLPVVGKMSMSICLLAISPFILLSIIGAFKVDSSRWFMPPNAEDGNDGSSSLADLFSWSTLGAIAWRPYLNNLFWNLNSFDNAATMSADIENPGRVLPAALGWSVLMVGCCYFIPLLVALGASDAKQSDWVDGYFSVVATEVAGPWLGGWLIFAAGISNIGLFQAELSSDAFRLLGMAERGYLPKIFAQRSQHGTPTYGLLLGTLVIICMTVTDLDSLIEMLNFNYSLSLFVEYLAFLKLRVSHDDLERPYRVPLSTLGCFIFFAPSLIGILIVIGLASYKTYLFSLVANAVGLLIYDLRHRERCRSRTGRCKREH